MFTFVFTLLGLAGEIITEVIKKIFTMVLVAFLAAASALTLIVIALDHAVG